MTLTKHLRKLPHYLLPQRFITRCAYRLTRIRTAWFKNAFIRLFIAYFNVNMSEAVEPDPTAYPDFNTFFTRRLHPESRPITASDDVACCPVDGTVSQAGGIADDAVFQAKGHHFSLTELLGGDIDRALPFGNGSFATLYLSPRDYHRIHMPLSGRLREMVHIPGKLFSVSPLATRAVPNLFARNERVVTLFDTKVGPMALVLVGALNVASMETVWAGAITPPLGQQIQQWSYQPDAVTLAKGEEMGRFNMGSTVIVLFGSGAMRWNDAIQAGASIRLGQPLAQRLSSIGNATDHAKG